MLVAIDFHCIFFPATIWFPIFFKISSFVLNRKNTLTQVWIGIKWGCINDKKLIENFNCFAFHVKLKSQTRLKKKKYDTLSVIGASFKSGRNERTGALRRLRDSVLDESFDILSVSKGLGSFLAAFNAKIKACSWGLDDRLGSWHYASVMATYHRSCSSPVLRNRVVFCRWDLRVLLQTPHMHTDLAYHSVTKYIMALAHLWNKYELNQTLSTHVQTQMCLTLSPHPETRWCTLIS